jgi:hypothetical protein
MIIMRGTHVALYDVTHLMDMLRCRIVNTVQHMLCMIHVTRSGVITLKCCKLHCTCETSTGLMAARASS